MSDNKPKVDIQDLTIAELNIAEKKAGQSLTQVLSGGEDAPLPLHLLAALVWVFDKRTDPTLDWNEFLNSQTLRALQTRIAQEEETDE